MQKTKGNSEYNNANNCDHNYLSPRGLHTRRLSNIKRRLTVMLFKKLPKRSRIFPVLFSSPESSVYWY